MRSQSATLRRRQVLELAVAAGLFGRSAFAAPAASPRIVTFDWGLTATAIKLGAQVVGLPSPEYYNISTVEPVLPSDAVDVGLLYTPNFEILDELAPDLIFIPPSLEYAAPMFSRICPVITVDINGDGGDVLGQAISGTMAMARQLNLQTRADCLLEAYEKTKATIAQDIGGLRKRPLVLASMADDRHLVAFGSDTLFGNIVDSLFLTNAMPRITPDRGRSVIGIEQLAAVPEASIVMLAAGGNNAVPSNSAAGIFWTSLPAVREGRMLQLASVLEDGGIPAAIRFMELLAAQASILPRPEGKLR